MLLLGLWLGAGLFMTWATADSYDSVDRALKPVTRSGEQALNDIGVERARVFLRYFAAEQNRYQLRQWGLAQLVLAVFLLLVLLFATNGNKWMLALSAGMLAAVILQQFAIRPRVIELGRALDFASVDEMRDERRSYFNYQKGDSYLEFGKITMLLVIGGRLIVSSGERRKRRRRSGEVDAVDNTENGHVDRRVRTSHRSHRGEALGGEQDKVAGAGVDGVEGD